MRIRPWFDWMNRKACTKDKRATTQYQLRSRAVIHHQGKSPERRRYVGATEGRLGPEGGRPAYNLKRSGNAMTTDLLKQSRASVQRRWPDGRNPRLAGRGGRPHSAASRVPASRGRQAHRPYLLTTDATGLTARTDLGRAINRSTIHHFNTHHWSSSLFTCTF